MARIVIFLWLSLITLVSVAQQTGDIYRVEVPVTSQSDAERSAAAKANLGGVITKIAGDAALQHPLVQQAIDNAPNYLAQFSYSSDTQLVLQFSPQAIRQLLQDAQLISGNNAQGVLVTINNVQDFASFKQVQFYLKSVGFVRRADLISVNKDELQYNLVLDGDLDLLKNSLAAANKLQWVSGDAQTPLVLHWQN